MRRKCHSIQRVYQSYIQSVIDHINARVESTDFISSMSVFDPHHLPKKEEVLSTYGMEKIKVLTSFYGTPQKLIFDVKEAVSQPDVEPEEAESKWKLFRRIIFKQYSQKSLQDVL